MLLSHGSKSAGDVLLESPLLPVNEGDRVTLRCIWNPNKRRTEGTFGFFKDGFCIGNSTSGNLTIPSASLSDSGLYMCGDHQGALSAESRLEVLKTTTGRPPQLHEGTASSLTSVMSIVLPVSAANLVLLCLAFFCLRRKHKESDKHDIFHSTVAIFLTPEPKILTDLKTGLHILSCQSQDPGCRSEGSSCARRSGLEPQRNVY